MRISPDVGSMSRFVIFNVVVLPQPDGPTRTQISPAPTLNDRPFTAPGPSFARANRFDTSRNSTVAPRAFIAALSLTLAASAGAVWRAYHGLPARFFLTRRHACPV
jgi:hypothetical protein